MSARFLHKRTEHTSELLELLEAGALTSDERDNWQRRHMHGLIVGLDRYEERLLATVKARLMATRLAIMQPPLLAAATEEPDDGVERYVPRHAKEPVQPRVGHGGHIVLPALKGMDGTLAPRPGEPGRRQRWDMEAIKRDNPVPPYLARRGIVVNRGKCRCFVHHSRGDECMSVNDTYVHCFSCGWGGDIVHIVQQLDGLDFHSACAHLGGQQVAEPRLWMPPGSAPPPEPAPELGQINLTPLVNLAHAELMAQETQLARQAGAYLRGRGFREEDWVRFRLGIISQDTPGELLPLTSPRAWLDGKTERRPAWSWRERILIPDRDSDGNVVYAKARLFLPQQPTQAGRRPPQKYLNPAGLSTRPFGFERMPLKGDLLVVEGELDALSVASCYTGSVIAVAGVHNFKQVHADALAARGGRVYLLLDPDCLTVGAAPAGGTVDARRIVELLMSAGCDVRLVSPLSDDPADDVNALLVRWGPQQLARQLHERVRVAGKVRRRAPVPSASSLDVDALVSLLSARELRVV